MKKIKGPVTLQGGDQGTRDMLIDAGDGISLPFEATGLTISKNENVIPRSFLKKTGGGSKKSNGKFKAQNTKKTKGTKKNTRKKENKYTKRTIKKSSKGIGKEMGSGDGVNDDPR